MSKTEWCKVSVCVQDVSGGKPVPVEGTALPLWGLEIDPERAKEDFRAYNAKDGGKVCNIWLIFPQSPA